MKFEEASVTAYLVKHLEPLSEADPSILAEYVVALLKKDKPANDLRKLCGDNLVEFLGHSAESFVAKLFQALEDDSVVRADDNLDAKESEPPPPPVLVDTTNGKSSSPKEENLSTSESLSDTEGKEVNDDDDRNHKHRRRDAHPHSFDNDVQEQFIRRPNRKRNKPYDNGYPLLESNRSNEIRKDYSSSVLAPLMRTPLDLGPRPRVNQAFRSDPVSRFDLSISTGRPSIGRGIGRSTNPWSQNDSRINSVDPFMGAGLPNVTSTQNGTWGALGYFPGISNGIFDPLHPLNLQGSLQPTTNPPLNLGMPRQRCRDFEEQGFCMRGDMCPMEHGLNRIVVEDVQSLSQFNLPVSIPSSHTSLPMATASSHLTNKKFMPNKNSKSGVTDGALRLNGSTSAPGDGDTDVYDPDQPLWNNGCPETSSALLWNTDSSAHQSSRLSDGMGNKLDSDFAHGNESKEYHEAATSNIRAPNQSKLPVSDGTGLKSTAVKPRPIPRKIFGRIGGGTSRKAQRTLFVSGIPPQSNRLETLLSHFQKFGEVIDLYIPRNTENAFVQYSKREEADAALKAPDAVMGNRFIKLWWAKRDRISYEGQASGQIKSVQDPGGVMPIITVPPSIADRRKTSLLSLPQKGHNVFVSDTLSPTTTLPRTLLGNGPKPPTPITQKKLEVVELLNEEIRKKQESLDQKRDLLRKQLDEYEKQTISNKKGGADSEHTVKRLKVYAHEAVAESIIPKMKTPNTMMAHEESEKISEKSNPREITVSPTSKPNVSSLQQSPRNIKQTSRRPTPSAHRFKLDNRPTSFRILSPLPADLANVTALEDHYSSFGDLSSVFLEETEDHSGNAGLESSQKISAVITFVTRHSAERAYLSGKCWKGHSLQLTWLSISSNSNNDGDIGGNPPRLIPRVDSNAVVKAVESSSLNVGNGDSVDEEGTDQAPICLEKVLEQTSQSSPTMSSYVAMDEDKTEVVCAHRAHKKISWTLNNAEYLEAIP